MFRKIILNIHIYGGLLCFSYLILLGISTLNFNHAFAFTQTPKGIWVLIRELHGQHQTYAGSIFASTWAWYTDLSTCIVLFAGISGIYLWTRRRREHRIGLILIAVATVVSVPLMLFIALHD